MPLLAYSLLFLVCGVLMIPSYGLFGLWIAGAGLGGVLLSAALYLWGSLTGRIDPFPLTCRAPRRR